MKIKNNVKAHIRATQDPQNNQTEGGALCDASCSASSFDLERGYQWVVDRWKNGFSEEEERVRNELRKELRSAGREMLLQK